MRVAITILYNALHHLRHNDWADFMAANFDHWIVVEGLASNGGSTNWCKSLTLPPRSTDGTHEVMEDAAAIYDHIHYYSPGARWISKDQMVQKAIAMIPVKKCYLWQVDADEQWTKEQLVSIENRLGKSSAKVAQCQFRHHVKQYIAKGAWGSGWVKRVWKYTQGQQFKSHEPPTLTGEGKQILQVPEKFEHFSYTFEQDVAFKSKYYRGYEQLQEKWRSLPDREVLTINHLFSRGNPIGRSATKLIRQ